MDDLELMIDLMAPDGSIEIPQEFVDNPPDDPEGDN